MSDAAPPTNSTAPPAGGGEPVVDDETLLFHITLILIALLGAYALVRLPRAFALFRTSGEWLNGHFLHHTPHRPSARPFVIRNRNGPTMPNASQRRVLRSSCASRLISPHASSRCAPARPLHARIAPGFSVTQLFIVVMWFYWLVYAGFYRSNIFTDGVRTGWICIAQLPFVYAFAQKNSILGSLMGYGYEKLNFLHRFVGRLVVLAANMHAFHYFYKWTLKGTFADSIKELEFVWAMVALICFDMLFFCSTKYGREKSYNLFLATHIVGFILVLPAIYYHIPDLLPYILACVGIFALDHVLEMTRVEIPNVNAGWRAGQHVRLRVMSTGMGWIGWAEVHPFTIANVSKSEEGMVLMCKKAGRWTRNLYEIAKKAEYTEGGMGKVKVVVEGPYGSDPKDLAGESRVKIIELVWIIPDPACLAPLLPTLSSLLQQSVFTPLRISVFYTRAPTGQQPAFFASSSAGPFSGLPPMSESDASPQRPTRPPPLNLKESPEGDLRSPIKGSAGMTPAAVTFNFNVKFANEKESTPPLNVGHKRSRTSGSIAQGHVRSPSSAPAPSHFPPGLSLAPGRPRLVKFFEQAIQQAVSVRDEEMSLSGLTVGVCGPVGLADDVAKAVGSIDPGRRDQIGGVEVCEEVFGW
ncbi:hypothetical protein BDZ97DRAFT_1922018 [Flammula alnicola]|nr:hypothetical protein BDZ97DRAFT_1922018 [Flammula alnicola]